MSRPTPTKYMRDVMALLNTCASDAEEVATKARAAHNKATLGEVKFSAELGGGGRVFSARRVHRTCRDGWY